MLSLAIILITFMMNSNITQSNTPRILIIRDQRSPFNLANIRDDIIRDFSKGNVTFFSRQIKGEIFIFDCIVIFQIIDQSLVCFTFVIRRGESKSGDSIPFGIFKNGDLYFVSEVDNLVSN